MITRQTRNNGETQGEETIVSNEIESKETNFTSLVRKLAYFNRSTANVLESENGSDGINRQYTLLKNKLDEAHDLIQIIQGLKLDSGESDEAIDQWTQERKLKLQPYENAVGKLDERLKYDESKRKEKALDDKLREESVIRDWMRREEQEAENNKRIREEISLYNLRKRNWKSQKGNVLNQNYQICKYLSSKEHILTG